MLRADSVSVTRGGRAVLSEVSLSVSPGELVAVIGPNGAGKSTLLSALAGELRPSSGCVWLEDRRILDWPLSMRARRLGVLPQESRLAFGFTARFADRLVLLEGGRVVAVGSSSEVLAPGLIEAVFGAGVSVIRHPTRAHPVVIAD